jgi:hypothetical protein
MLKILFDGLSMQNFPGVKFHGGGEYAKAILIKIIELNYHNFDIILSKTKELDIKIGR